VRELVCNGDGPHGERIDGFAPSMGALQDIVRMIKVKKPAADRTADRHGRRGQQMPTCPTCTPSSRPTRAEGQLVSLAKPRRKVSSRPAGFE
jgi:hypothetical protein